MSAAAGLHRNHASRKLAEKRQDLRSPQLLAQNCAACAVSSMHLEYILRQIEPDRDNLRHDRSPLWIIADPHWHIDAAGGRLHHQSLATGSRTMARAERAMRAVAMGRKNCIFVGSQTGGKSAAIAYTLIETAKLSGDDLLSWNAS